jgi:hypothetical protein
VELRTSDANQRHGKNLRGAVIADNVNSVHQATVGGLGCGSRGGFPKSGSARLGSQKGGLPLSLAGPHEVQGSRPPTRAQGRSGLVAAPSNWEKREAEDIKSPAYKDGAKLGKHVANHDDPVLRP